MVTRTVILVNIKTELQEKSVNGLRNFDIYVKFLHLFEKKGEGWIKQDWHKVLRDNEATKYTNGKTDTTFINISMEVIFLI